MANKDHTLDGKIISSAMREFMEKGYEKASLRKIAANAGVTIGAIYTRYSTKDKLFCSLVSPLLSDIETAFHQIEASYNQAEPGDSSSMAESMTMESKAIIHLLFDHYDLAVLLLCKSTGSSLEKFFDTVVDQKIQKSIEFFNSKDGKPLNPGILKVLISSQFNIYYQIIHGGYSLEEAKEMTEAAMIYHGGGWLSLLESM